MTKAASTERIERLLADRIGLDPASVGDNLIANGVRARMEALGLSGRTEYESALLGPGDELQALVEEIVIPESWFFRDDRPFESLREFARTGWLGEPGRSPLTALSVPCAMGEEPYSIAMALVEAGLSPERFRVEAVDVSLRSLERAIAGVYGLNSFRGVAPAVRSRFFREQSGRYSVNPEIRASVRFRVGNLLDPGLFEGHSPFDVVFCRNLLIYFDPPSRSRAFATLTRLTADGGLLFLGHADRSDVSAGTPFHPLQTKGSFGYRKGRIANSGVKPESYRRPIVPKAGSHPVPPLASNPAPAGAAAVPGKGDRVAIAPPSTVAADRSPSPPTPATESPAELLDQASTLANQGRYFDANRLVEQAVARGGPNARASSLLGLIRQAAGDFSGAEVHFLRAVYLDPHDDEALLALALLAGRRGDSGAEAGYRRRASRALSRKNGGGTS